MPTQQLPLGIRNNNPGNIRFIAAAPWKGLDNPAYDKSGFCIFKDKEWGLRALIIDLHTAMTADHEGTVEAIVTHYAPPTENNTEDYIKAVADFLQVDADEPLAPSKDLLLDFAKAITVHENGVPPDGDVPYWYSQADYEQAFGMTDIQFEESEPPVNEEQAGNDNGQQPDPFND